MRMIESGICIRPFEYSDLSRFLVAVHESVEKVGLWLPWCTADYSMEDAKAWFDRCSARLQSGAAYEYGVFEAADQRSFLGGISLNQLNREQRIANIGYWVRQGNQNRGVATTAARAIAAYGFSALSFTRAEIVAMENNLASRRVAEKVGAKFECIARNRLFVRGRPEAAAVYSLIPADLR